MAPRLFRAARHPVSTVSNRRRQARARRATAAGPETAPDSASDERRPVFPAYPPARYLGQLDDEFQREMASERGELGVQDCDFYHSIDLPDGTQHGYWDLRGHESEYFGGIEVAGRRVLELGPASGGLTNWLHDEGAEVVCIDAGFDAGIDLVPAQARDWRAERLRMAGVVDAVQNAWWYAKTTLGWNAKVVYAPIYDLPGDLGSFDVAVFGAILLHLRRPFDALEQAARRTTDAIVVTEPVDPEIVDATGAVVKFNPAGESHATTLWWSHSPAAIVEWLRILGFGDTTVTFHDQTHSFGHDRESEAQVAPMFTVVGRAP